MAGIVFTDIGNSLLPLIQMEQQDRQNALRESRDAENMRWQRERYDREEARKNRIEDEQKAALGYLPAALNGDRDAITKVVSGSPQHAGALFSHLDRMDAQQRAKIKDQADQTARLALGILQLPEDQQADAYKTALASVQAQGYAKDWSPNWDPQAKARLQFALNQARGVDDYFKEQGSRPQAMPLPGQGGTQPQVPDLRAKGGEYVNYLTSKYSVSPVAAAGIVGGLGWESGFNPTQKHDGGRGFGMAGWDPQRTAALQTFATKTGRNAADPTTQLDFVMEEMKSGDMGAQRAYALLQNAKTPEEATTAMMHYFRPQGYTPANPAGGLHYAQRVQLANQFMPGRSGPVPAPGPAPGAPMPAGGPQIAQGDNPGGMPGAGPSGTNSTAGMEITMLRQQARANGGDLFTVNGLPEIKDGHFVIRSVENPRIVVGMVPVKPKEPQAPPVGYRRTADGNLEFEPGGPADPVVAGKMADAKRKAEEKAIPQTVTKGLQENLSAIKTIDRALKGLDENPNAVGGYGEYVQRLSPEWGGDLNNKMDPKGTALRALISDIGSLKLHDRSGAAVTAAETPRLIPFIPKITDKPEVVKEKLRNFRIQYEDMMRDTLDYYSEANGFRPYTPATSYLQGGEKPAGAPAPAPGPTPSPAVAEQPRVRKFNPDTGRLE